MNNPDFLLEARVDCGDAMEHLGAAMGELRIGYDRTQGRELQGLAETCAHQAMTELDRAITCLEEAQVKIQKSLE